MSARAHGLAAALALATVALTGPAGAFCRTTTCNPSEEGSECELDADDCVVSGIPLHWPDPCISFSVQTDGSAKLGFTAELTDDVIRSAFASWLQVECEGGPPSLAVYSYPSVSCDRVEYNPKEPNANIWMYRDDTWEYGDATLALTTVTYNVDTGQIYDADVELNSAETVFTIGTPVNYDLLSVATHEAGHFLGFAHSPVEVATMFRQYAPRTTALASLEADDIAAMCTAYPPTRSLPSCNPEPRHGFAPVCGTPTGPSCSCETPPTSSETPALAGLALLGAVALGRHRVRRSRPRRA